MSCATPDLDDAAARWQQAFDAAARAIEADRDVLPAAAIAREAHRLIEERRETEGLLRSVAALRGITPSPWLSSSPVTARGGA
jgi:hypothetical protein